MKATKALIPILLLISFSSAQADWTFPFFFGDKVYQNLLEKACAEVRFNAQTHIEAKLRSLKARELNEAMNAVLSSPTLAPKINALRDQIVSAHNELMSCKTWWKPSRYLSNCDSTFEKAQEKFGTQSQQLQSEVAAALTARGIDLNGAPAKNSPAFTGYHLRLELDPRSNPPLISIVFYTPPTNFGSPANVLHTNNSMFIDHYRYSHELSSAPLSETSLSAQVFAIRHKLLAGWKEPARDVPLKDVPEFYPTGKLGMKSSDWPKQCSGVREVASDQASAAARSDDPRVQQEFREKLTSDLNAADAAFRREVQSDSGSAANGPAASASSAR